jgi:hypothetical protein
MKKMTTLWNSIHCNGNFSKQLQRRATSCYDGWRSLCTERTAKQSGLATRHDGAWGRGDIALLILYLCIRWGWADSFTPRFEPGKGPRYPLHSRLGGPQSRSGHRG